MNESREGLALEDSLKSVINQISEMNKGGFLFSFSRADDFETLYNLFRNTTKLFFSRKIFEEVLGKIYAKIKWKEYSMRSVLNTIEDFFYNYNNEYYFIPVLNHVDIKNEIIFGRIRLVKIVDKNFTILSNKFKHLELIGYKNKDVVIYGPFKAESYVEARNIGLLKTREFVNILRMVFDFIEDGNSGIKTQFGIEAHIYGQYASFNEKHYSPENIWSRQFIISDELKEHKILKRLWNIVDSTNEYTEIEQRIIDSLHWFGVSKMSYDSKQEFISYFTLLEGLLFAGTVGTKSSDLAERITKINFYNLNESFDKKEEFYKNIKTLYKLRGDLVHNAKNTISIDNVKNLNKIVRETFVKYLSISAGQSFKTKNDLRSWILIRGV